MRLIERYEGLLREEKLFMQTIERKYTNVVLSKVEKLQ